MWVVWYLTHIPGIRLEPRLAGPVLLAVLLISAALWTRGLGRRALAIGAIAGLTASILNLLILGSFLSRAGEAPGDSEASLVPSAGLLAMGFVLICTAIGAAGGWLGGVLAAPVNRPAGTWLARMGWIAVAAIVPLLGAGGAVTSAGAGMAVPDWPGTYGSNMFLFPIGLMADPYIFLEHTHRLLGALVGLVTLSLMIAVLRSRSPAGAKALAATLFAAVCVQGVLGAVRVTGISPAFGVVHGVTAQAIFAAAVVLATLLSVAWRDAGRSPSQTVSAARIGRGLAIATAAAVLVQLTLGALWRHLFSTHALWSHIGFSLVVSVLLVLLAAVLSRAEGYSIAGTRMRRIGNLLLGMLCLQIVLGFGAWMVVGDGQRTVMYDNLEAAPDPNITRTILATAHQLNGAALLGVVAAAAAWCRGASTHREDVADSRNPVAASALG
jgi:cytochrome c oxidase assembly protein subunit 15